jgi:hypothetical protein
MGIFMNKKFSKFSVLTALLILSLLASSYVPSFEIPTAKAATPVKIIFDTDMGSDVDDVGALATLHALADRGETEILATIFSSRWDVGDNFYGPGAIDAINTYFGRPNIPIGANKGSDVGDPNSALYNEALATNQSTYGNNVVNTNDVPDMVKVYRQTLAAQPDNSVVIMTQGHPIAIYHLLQSAGDAYSPLNGIDLIKKKVKYLLVAMGQVSTTPVFDWNLVHNNMASYMPYVLDNWPLDIQFVGVGERVSTGQALQKAPTNSPVRKAYELWLDTINTGRPSWGEIAVLYAVRGLQDNFSLITDGTKKIVNGDSLWDTSIVNPKHHRLIEKLSDSDMESIVSDLKSAAPGGSSPSPSNLLLASNAYTSTNASNWGTPRGKVKDLFYNSVHRRYAVKADWNEFGVPYGLNIGKITEANAFYWRTSWPTHIKANYISLGGAYPNQPQPYTMWKIEYLNNGVWNVLSSGQGGWIDGGIFTWGGASTTPIRFNSIRVKLYSDGIHDVVSPHFRARGGVSNNVDDSGTEPKAAIVSLIGWTDSTLAYKPEKPFYAIINANSRKAVSVTGISMTIGANIAQWGYVGNPDQHWILEPVGSGYFKIVAGHSGQVMELDTVQGSNVRQNVDNNTTNQHWKPISTGDGYYKMQNRYNGKMLDVLYASTEDNANIQVYADNGCFCQKWQLEPVGDVKVFSAGSGLALDVANASTENGGNIQQWKSNNCLCQVWNFVSLGNGYFRIVNKNSGKVVSIKNGQDANEANIHQWDYLGSYDDQKWRLVLNGDGSVQLRSKLIGNRNMDVWGFSTADGGNVQLFDATNTYNQQWFIRSFGR